MSEREFDYDLHYRSLPNDVRHLEISIQNAKNTACLALVKTGSRNENQASEAGLSHLTEHMVYMGTENYEGYSAWAKAVDSLGAEHDATAEKEYTEYYVFSPSEHTEKSIGLISELVKPTFPGKEMRRGKKLVIDEFAKYADDMADVTRELFEAFLYSGTPLAPSSIGDENSVKRLTRRDLRKYVDKWYRGANILVVTAGKIGRIKGFVDECFGDLPSGPMVPYSGHGGYGEPGTKVLTTSKTNEAHFLLGVPGVAMSDERYAVLKVIEVMLGGSESTGSSRLYQKVQIKDAQTYDLSTGFIARSDTGYLAVEGSVNPKYLKEVLATVRREMFKLADTSTKEEVRRAKAFLRGEMKRDFENTLSVGQRIGLPALMYDKVEHPRDLIKRINSVKLDDVRRVAEELLDPDKERLVVVGPINEKLKQIRKIDF